MAEEELPVSYPPRKSLRREGYDYTKNSFYSLTICTHKRHPFFNITKLRTILEEEWEALSQHFTGVEPRLLRIMPDHIHCSLWIDGETNGTKSLSDIIGGYKSITNVKWIQYLKQAGIKGPGKIWERGFHDHIIRNEADLQEKERYIRNNPIKHQLKEE